MVEKDTVTTSFQIRPDRKSEKLTANLDFTTTPASKEEIDEIAEQYEFGSQSQAYRYFLTLGAMAVSYLDPQSDQEGEKIDSETGYQPLTLRDILPESREEALDIRDEVLDEIDEQLITEVTEDPLISQDGWEVWLDK